MKNTTFDITGLFAQAFPNVARGKRFDAYSANPTGIRQEKAFDAGAANDTDFFQYLDFEEELRGLNAEEQFNFLEMRDVVKACDHIGRPLFMPCKIARVLLPNEPTISISSRKNIVETALAGSTRRGTVKELIAIEDWEITIRGIALNTESRDVYPEDQVKKLNQLYGKNAALDIECALTNLLGIYRVVIKSFSLPEMVGIQHAQAYEFVCVSDEDFVLEI